MASSACDALGIVQVQRLLLDEKPELRVRATQSIASKTEGLFRDHAAGEAYRVLDDELHHVDREFLKVNAAVYRRAGLLVVRAVIRGMSAHACPDDFVQAVAAITFNGIGDDDAKIRLIAVEILHELLRKVRLQLIRLCFFDLFCSLACGVCDHDKTVVLLAEDVSTTVAEMLGGDSANEIDIPLFIRFLCTALQPHVRRVHAASDESRVVEWVLGWVGHMLDMPALHFADHLPQFLDLLLKLSVSYPSETVFSVLRRCQEATTRRAGAPPRGVHASEILSILTSAVEQISAGQTLCLCLQWAGDIFDAYAADVWSQIPAVLQRAVLPQIGADDAAVRAAVQLVNDQLDKLVHEHYGGTRAISETDSVGAGGGDAMLACLFQSVLAILQQRRGAATLHAGLQWLLTVNDLTSSIVEGSAQELVETTVYIVSDSADESAVCEYVATICAVLGERRFDLLLCSVFRLMHEHPEAMFDRQATVMRLMQLRISGATENGVNCEQVLVQTARLLCEYADRRFVYKCVLICNSLLLTGSEFATMRALLRRGSRDERAWAVFEELYRCWSVNAVATLSLCLLVGANDLAFEICQYIGRSEVSVGTLSQVDRLVQLLETPVFTPVRLAIIRPSQSLSLLQTLFALLALLPQSSPQYMMLYRRLEAVPCLRHLELETAGGAAANRDVVVGDGRLQEMFASFEREQAIMTRTEHDRGGTKCMRQLV